MRKLFLSAAILLSLTSFGQGRPQQITQLPKSNRAFATPFALYTVGDTTKAYRIGIYAIIDDNSGIAQFNYGLFDSHNRPMNGSEGFYRCVGNCYNEVYDANDSNSAFTILVDSAIHQPLK